MSAPAPLVEMRGVRRRFPGVLAVDGADLTVRAGEILGLVGPNGAGKSTLIKMLAGALAPDEGEIRVAGRPVAIRGPQAASRLGLAFVHQEPADVPNLTVAENVALGLGYPRRFGFWLDRRALRANTAGTLERLGCRLPGDAFAGTLSVAQRRLVMIARGLAADAKLLVLDEPSASLTAEEITQLHDVIRRLAAGGTAILYVSHRLDEIFALTQRVVVMRQGRVVADEPTARLDSHTLIGHIAGHVGHAPRRARRDGDDPPAAGDARPRPELLRADGLSAHGVRDVSFALREGEVLGIAGLVGSGRTELARLLFGADRLAAGMLHLEGRRLALRSPRDALRAGIALLPEDRRGQGMVLDFSIRENMTLPSLRRFRARGMLPFPSVAAERAVASGMMRELALRAPDEERPVRLLSGGNQQKVVLARWLVRGARVLIFDEPTHGVDVTGKVDLYRRIAALAEAGRGVIFISSEFEELAEVCSRVLVMREGALVAELRDDDVSVERMIAHCYADVSPADAPGPSATRSNA